MVPFKCVQFVRELAFAVAARGVMQAVKRRAEKALSEGIGTAGPLQKPTVLIWFYLLGFPFFYSYKAIGSKFKS